MSSEELCVDCESLPRARVWARELSTWVDVTPRGYRGCWDERLERVFRCIYGGAPPPGGEDEPHEPNYKIGRVVAVRAYRKTIELQVLRDYDRVCEGALDSRLVWMVEQAWRGAEMSCRCGPACRAVADFHARGFWPGIVR